MHAGGAAEGVHFETGVIRKAVEPGLLIQVLGLDYRIIPEGLSRLRDVPVYAEGRGRNKLEALAEDFLGLAQLVQVARSEYYLHFAVLDTSSVRSSLCGLPFLRKTRSPEALMRTAGTPEASTSISTGGRMTAAPESTTPHTSPSR